MSNIKVGLWISFVISIIQARLPLSHAFIAVTRIFGLQRQTKVPRTDLFYKLKGEKNDLQSVRHF